MATVPFLRGLRPTLHIAHRGGALLAPENTLEAFRAAVEVHRTDMLETDVHLSQDGEVIVAHDDTVDRCTDGAGAIRSLTLAELKRLDAGHRFTRDGGQTFPFRGRGVRLPTFRELLRAFPTMRLNVDLKDDDPALESAFARVVREEGALERICCGSEHDGAGERLLQLMPEACHFYPRDAAAGFLLSLRAGDPPIVDDRYTVLDIPAEFQGVWLIDELLVQTAERLGKWINVWTIDEPNAMRTLIGLRVGGIMTDRPDLLRTVLDEPRVG